VELERVDLAEIDALTGGDWHVAGELNASLTLRGTTGAPRAEGEVRIDRGAFREFQYAQLAGRVNYTPERAAIDLRLDQSPGIWLAARGTVPLGDVQAEGELTRPGEPLDVRIESSPIALSVVQGAFPTLADVEGTLLVDVHATGTLADPRFDGEVRIDNGAFTIDPLEARYQQLNARVRLLGDRVAIEEFRLLDEDGNPLRIAGGVTLREKQVGVVDIRIDTERFSLLDNRLGEFAVTTDLRVVGEPLRPRVTGTIAVQRGRLEVDRILEQVQAGFYATEAAGAPGLQPIPAAGEVVGDEAAVAAGARPEAADEPDEPTMFDNLALDLRVTVPDNLVLRGDDLRIGGRGLNLGDVNVTIGGDLEVTKPAGDDLLVAGTVRTVRGFYEFQGRRFEVDRDSTISWRGPDPADPVLDITARRDIAGVEARVQIRGTAQKPELALSSTPPLDEADVLSLIVFNRPINDLGQGERVSLAERAGGLAAGFVAAPVAEALRGALDVDLFEIEAAGNGGPTLTIGDQIGERVFVRFRRQFGAQDVNEFLLEYRLADFLRLQTSIAEGGGNNRVVGQRVERGGIDLIFFLAY
jgi:translocation and assembly module TamB